MDPNTSRLVQCTLLIASVTVWFAGIWWWGFAVLELIAREEKLHNNHLNSQCFVWLGGVGACLLSAAVISYGATRIPKEARLYTPLVLAQMTFCAFCVILALVCTLFTEPFTQWRKYQLTLDGLDDGVPATKTCLSGRETYLEINTSHTYLTLLSHGGAWAVQLDNLTSEEVNDHTFFKAPLVFRADVPGTVCTFTETIYAGCMVKGRTANCNWNKTGNTTTHIRRMDTAIVEPDTLQGFNVTLTYEYNAPSHSEATQFIIDLNSARKKFLSYTTSYIGVLTCATAFIAIHKLYTKYPVEREEEASGAEDPETGRERELESR